jgi:hypothetical protein
MTPIHEMIVFVENRCDVCKRVLVTAKLLHEQHLIADLVTINNDTDPIKCREYGVVIYPAVFINRRLAFYGEFSPEEALSFAADSARDTTESPTALSADS